MKAVSLNTFYDQMATLTSTAPNALLPSGIQREIGHFNVFNLADLIPPGRKKLVMPYDRRAYYKISLIKGRHRAEYADKVIAVERHALLFATPQVPYHWVPLDKQQAATFCIFTPDFLRPATSGVVLDELPIFQAGAYPIFEVSEEQCTELGAVFKKMQRALASNYAYKYDFLRAYVLELIHFGQELQPPTALHPAHTAAARVTALFVELLERQFPIESPHQRVPLRTAKEYADRLAVHVNHLNRVLKETTGHTTTDLIGGRIIQEAKTLLQHTNWTVSEISDSLGFAEVAHFSNFFKRYTALSPAACRA